MIDTALKTPGKKPLTVPTQALADAIVAEWEGRKSFNPAAMPLTSLAYTAIDRIEGERENIIEVLLAYVDTDTLCYRTSSPPSLKGRGDKSLAQLQKEQWDPLLAWAGNKFSALWKTTSNLMPLEQPKALHEAIRSYLGGMDAMQLGACGVLASLYSSLVLALAVMENRLKPEEAFTLCRLEETFQAEAWGDDEDTVKRKMHILEEIKQVARFINLLKMT